MCVAQGRARKAVTTMATTLIDWRPSALPFACPSIVPAPEAVHPAPVHVLGLPALPVVRTEPMFAGLGAVKINNYIGTPAAVPAMGRAATGATTSSVIAMATGDLRNQQRGVDKVKGSDARGIPPRGRPKV
jgi:hypothetical protein